MEMRKWLALNDPSGAKLKLASIDVQGVPILHVFITNLSYNNPKWDAAIKVLNFNAAAGRKFLVRRVEPGEQRLVASKFHPVFPQAKLVDMPVDSYLIKNSERQAKTQEEKAVDVDMRGVVRLGRNADGKEVFASPSGRFFTTDKGVRVMEDGKQSPHLFLRMNATSQEQPTGIDFSNALLRVAGGFVAAMDLGEVQHSEDFDAFHKAIFPNQIADSNSEALLSAAIDGALVSYAKQRYDVAQEAFSPVARLYDFLPAYRGATRGHGAMPAPLSVAAQRLLGDTATKSVLFPNAYDGASFAFLPEDTQIRAYQSHNDALGGGQDRIDLSLYAPEHQGAQWFGSYSPASQSGVDAVFFNADPSEVDGVRQDYVQALQCLSSLSPNGRAVFVLAADTSNGTGAVSPESFRFLSVLCAKYSVEDVFETAPVLSQKCGGVRGLRVLSILNAQPATPEAKDEQQLKLRNWHQGVRVLTSWDQVKSHIDETILRIDLKEAQSRSIDLERIAASESYQRPYIAFSKIGEARTMVPSNLQASCQVYMTRLENLYGSVDEFVGKQLGMGRKTLATNFSPEQIDGVATMISRYMLGRSSLLADDTGIGKGRQLAAAATWANKRGSNVVFITDRANLFSDLARDLKDIGEWDRFRPLVINTDGEITYEESPGAEPTVLAKGTPAADMMRIMDKNLSMQDIQRNIAFLTYSQISTEDSPKALWIKNQLDNALVIFDESHIAAGSDSNIAKQVSEIAAQSKYVQFASATWAKTHDNMHIYQRALPASVSVASLSETMRRGGDSFSEIFSTMLSSEGALIRREHDLSKLEIEMVIDDVNRARNEAVSDKIADVLGSAAYISGDMQQVFIRANSESVRNLRGARDARSGSIKAKLFSAQFGSGSVIYQVMKATQGALNATHVADLAIESIEKGMKPVIVSDATGESLVEAMIEEMMEKSGGDRPDTMKPPTLQDMLRHVIFKRLATVRVEEVTQADILADDLEAAEETLPNEANPDRGEADATDDADVPVDAATTIVEQARQTTEGETAVQTQQAAPVEQGVDVRAAFGMNELPDADDNLEEDSGQKKKKRPRVFSNVLISDLPDMPEQAKALYAEGLKEIEAKIAAVPNMMVVGFDVIAQRLRDKGISVGEISGRKHALVHGSAAGAGEEDTWRFVTRAKSKKAVKATIRSFNNGQTDVVIINRSAAAGVSMHSSPRFLDQRRRHLIEHQIPEDPVNRVQLLGRVNRYDQLSSPLITTASTGIYGEVRYLMMQNRKLARMSANVRSSRDNAMSLKGVVELFNVVGREAAQGYLQDNPLIAKRLGITDMAIEYNPDLVNKLTMSIPLLLVAQQEQVYADLYSRVEEILLRAELEGENPLRPRELDVRAKTEEEIVFYGDESPVDEFTSAFDAPVKARRITWTQERNPLGFTAVKEAAKVNLERLMQSGYLLPGALDANGVPGQPVVNSQLLDKVVGGFHGLTRLAHLAAASALNDLDCALSFNDAVCKVPSARRAYLKHAWIKNNLQHLIPGAEVAKVYSDGEALGAAGSLFTTTVVTDVRPPANETDLLDPGKWKITVVSSGDERPQTYTLRSVLTAMTGLVTIGEITKEPHAVCFGSLFRPCLFSGKPRDVDSVRNGFDFVARGTRVNKETVLTGNMYLAAEWAAATKQGKQTIYTDESGERHRVILLDKDASGMNPSHLPVRVADPDMLNRFLLPFMSEDLDLTNNHARRGEICVLDTTIKSAFAAMFAQSGTSGATSFAKRDSILAIVPEMVMAISCSAKDVKRIQSALSSGQRALRAKANHGIKTTAASDPAHVVVRSFKARKDMAKLPSALITVMRTVDLSSAVSDNIFSVSGAAGKKGSAAVLTLSIDTPAKAARAVQLIRENAGLEVYATSEAHKSAARSAIQSVLTQRRENLRALQVSSLNSMVGEPNVTPITPFVLGDDQAQQNVVLQTNESHQQMSESM